MEELIVDKLFWTKILGVQRYNRLLRDILKENKIKNENICFNINILEPYYQKALKKEDNAYNILSDTISFRNFYNVFVDTAILFWKEHKNAYLHEIKKDLAKCLYQKIELLPIRVLIQDIHIKEKKGLLRGNSEEERYEDYEKRFLGNTKYVDELCCAYPEMKRLLFIIIKQTVEELWKLDFLIKKDKQDLVDYLCGGQEFNFVKRLEMGLSDPHSGGKTVVKLWLDNNFIIIYKPHSLYKEQLFLELNSKLLSGIGLRSANYRIINCKDYGWEEVVPEFDCNKKIEVEHYFERMGVLLFLAYIMSATDIHCENIIASGEFPVLLDLETFPGFCERDRILNVEQMIQKEIKNSVLSTGILPVYVWGENTDGVIVSALHNTRDVLTPFKVPMICMPQRTDIHIEYHKKKIQLGHSLPTFLGRKVNPIDYQEKLCFGFTKAYRYMLNHMDEVSSTVEEFYEAKSRVILHHTQYYKMYLTASLYPEFLKNIERRRFFLHILEDENSYNNWNEYEKCSLRNLDIPIFYIYGKEKYLLDGNDKVYSNFLKQTAFECWKEKSKRLGEKYLKQQNRFIKLSLALLEDKQGVQQWDENALVINSNTKNKILKEIADIICNCTVIYGKKKDINWSGLRFFNEKVWSIVPLGMYLYDGIGGIGIYMALTCVQNYEEKYTRIFTLIKNKLFKYTDEVLSGNSETESLHTGCYIGEGSVVHTYIILFDITGEKEFLKYAKRHCKIMIRLVGKDTSTDLFSGIAGAVVVLMKLYKRTNEDRYLKKAIIIGEKLWKNAKKQDVGYGFWENINHKALTGLAHGNSGYILAYSYLLESVKCNKYYDRIIELLKYEDSLYKTDNKNWLDLRTNESNLLNINAWCNGAAGIMLSRIKLYTCAEFQNNPIIMQDIFRGLYALSTYSSMNSVCLCHGITGNYWILQYYIKICKDKTMESVSNNLLNKIIELYYSKENILLKETYNLSLMTGILGIGICMSDNWELQILC